MTKNRSGRTWLYHVVWSEILRLLEDPTLIQTELNRRLESARHASPTRRRLETLNRESARVRKHRERLLTAYQEELLSLEANCVHGCPPCDNRAGGSGGASGIDDPSR
ncbi:MAG: hypothetical protein L0Y38_04335 [Methylococcaceae bacterium]|nr:hypothetical protein [Methylococcaceae bacterium]